MVRAGEQSANGTEYTEVRDAAKQHTMHETVARTYYPAQNIHIAKGEKL